MPTIRYEMRNEYGLSDPELYHAAGEDDPEALLESVAMAGLVGVLRQLGDLSEFAAEIFHYLHEEVTATAARGHELMLRVQQLEVEFPSIEKAFLSRTNPSPLAHSEGIDWHANLRMDQNLVTRGDMPRFILDSYEECRGLPRLFMMDKFDGAGAGACLKRFSDPSFFKVDLASSGMMEEVVREKKARKVKKKKKGSRWRNAETTKSFLAPLIRSNLQPVISEKVSAKVPMRHIKLKSRNLMDSDITNKRSYMEHLLEVHSPEKKAINQVGPVAEVHESTTNTVVYSPILMKRNDTLSPAKMETENLPVYELANQKIEGIETLMPAPDEKVMMESKVKTTVTVHGYNSNEAEKCSPEIVDVDQKKSFVDTQITIADGLDGHGSVGKNRTEALLDGYSSNGVGMDSSPVAGLDQKNPLSQCVLACEGDFDGHRSHDVGSELENYMDALHTIKSEIETDPESRQKSDPGILNMGVHMIDGFSKQEQELRSQFLEPDDFGNPAEKGLSDMLISSHSTSGNLNDEHQYQEDTHNFNVPVILEICLNQHDWTPEDVRSPVEEFIPSIHLLTNDTCNVNGSEAITTKAATVGAYSSPSVSESTSCGDNICLRASDEGQSLTIHPTETFSGYMEGCHGDGGQQLNGNMEELSKSADNSEVCPVELLHLSDMGGSFLGGKDAPEDTYFIKHADESPSFSLHPLNEAFLGYTNEVSQQLTAKEEVSESADIYDTDELLFSPKIGGSFSASKGSPEEIHFAECPKEMSDRACVLDGISLKQDCSSLNDAVAQFDDTTLLTMQKMLHIDRENTRPLEQEMEELSCESISLTIPYVSANTGSSVVKSDDSAVGMKGMMNPESLTAEMSSNNVRLSHGVGDNSDGSLPCTVHTSELVSQDHDGMEYLKSAAYSNTSSDNILPESVVPERADTAEDAEELFSEDTDNTQGNSFMIEVPTRCINEPTISFSEEGTVTLSGMMLPETNFDLSMEDCTIGPQPGEVAATVDNSAALYEDLIVEDTGETKILLPNFLTLELEQFSATEEPENSHEMVPAELSPGGYVNNICPDGKNLLSTEPVCMVIGEIDVVTDNLGFPCSPTMSKLHEEDHFEKNTECDYSLDEFVIIEADDDNRNTCSIYSPVTPTFNIESQEDYLPGSAAVDSYNLELNERCNPKSTTVMPHIDNKTISSPSGLCSEFPSVGSSCSSDAKLSDGVCQTTASESNVGKRSLLFSSVSEDSFSKEDMELSTSFLLERAIPLVDDNERNVISSNQEGKHLDASNIQFERAFSDEQTISQSHSVDIYTQSLKPEPVGILTTVKMHELDIPSSSDTRYGQRDAEAIPSGSTSEISTGSMTSDIFQVNAGSSSGIYETGSQECLEPQVVEATQNLQLQDVEGTSSLPPLPPVQEFLEPKIIEEASSLQLLDVEGTPPPPLPPVEWRLGKLRFGSLISVGDTAQPPEATNLFMASSRLDVKYPQGSLTTGVEMVERTPLPLSQDERILQGSLNSENLIQHTELPLIEDKEGPKHGMSQVSRSENEGVSCGHEVLVLEDNITQHSWLLQGAHSIEDKRPRLGQLVPSLELERSKHESKNMGDPMLSMNPFLTVSSAQEFKHQYTYGLYGGESPQHLNLSVPLLGIGPNMPPYGFLYPMGENPSMIYDFMVPCTEGERPAWKHRSIRDRPRNPIIEAVAAHDKSLLRKVSELEPPKARPKEIERDSLLEQIRNKSFNLKPANAPMPNMKGPPTNLKFAAILEKANAIRQAFVGSDEDDDDGQSWNDS